MTTQVEQYEKWIWDRMVCRSDFANIYTEDGKVAWPQSVVTGQFAGIVHQAATGEIAVALQCKGPNGAKYTFIDVDCHMPNVDCAAQEKWAFEMYQTAKKQNLNPLLEASGRGYHVWIFYSSWCDWKAAQRVGLELSGGECEVYPCRGWVNHACRIPGKHPRGNGLASKFWDGAKWLEWGDEAIDFICTFAGIDPPQPVEGAEIERPPKQEQSKKSRGLGDTIAKVTRAVGIKPCGGCKRRQEKLNEMFPYANAV